MDESYQCTLYVKERQTEESWMCEICRMKEIKIPLRSNYFHIWEQYQLACGHVVHPRCYRKWCFKNECVGCPTCGKKEEVDSNKWCRHCWTWGHANEECPVWRMGSQHRIIMRYRQLQLSDI
jgi:hypothetical protein